MPRLYRSQSRPRVSLQEFPIPDRVTVSGLRLGDVCFECRCRVVAIDGPDRIALAWCDCSFPENHHEMEVLGN